MSSHSIVGNSEDGNPQWNISENGKGICLTELI